MSMSEQPRAEGSGHRRLESWKEIASHFGVSVRTVQSWEGEQGLPVHRMPGARGRVYAHEEELEAWVAGREKSEATAAVSDSGRPRRRWRLWAWPLGAAVLLFVLAVGLRLWQRRIEPSAVEVRGRSIVVSDAGGRKLWEYGFPNLPIPRWAHTGPELFELTRPMIGDFDGDGRSEVVFTYTAGFRREHVSEVYCFESDGKLRWKYRPGRLVSAPNGRFPPPYSIRMTIPVAKRDGKTGLVIVVSYHGYEYPTQVTALSLQGRVMGEYWHSGHFFVGALADLERDGREELYLAGISNATREATLVALDPEDLGGTSQEQDPDYQLQGFEPGKEVARIILPASEITRQTQEFPIPTAIRQREGKLELRVRQSYSISRAVNDPEVEYAFRPRLKLLGAQYSSTMAPLLERLFRKLVLRRYEPAADLERIKRIRVLEPWREAPRR